MCILYVLIKNVMLSGRGLPSSPPPPHHFPIIFLPIFQFISVAAWHGIQMTLQDDNIIITIVIIIIIHIIPIFVIFLVCDLLI